jgi:hypothetical protein
MARRGDGGLTPDESIYRLKPENKALRDEIRLLNVDHKEDIKQLKTQYRTAIRRLNQELAKLKRRRK